MVDVLGVGVNTIYELHTLLNTAPYISMPNTGEDVHMWSQAILQVLVQVKVVKSV
jgi:hypothetical protein